MITTIYDPARIVFGDLIEGLEALNKAGETLNKSIGGVITSGKTSTRLS